MYSDIFFSILSNTRYITYYLLQIDEVYYKMKHIN